MSNPAVITLDSLNSRSGKFKRFQLEDNIGESIHLHIDNMRVDFTINEFLIFSEMIRQSLKEIEFLPGYNIDDFDEYFLKECTPFLKYLKEIKIEEVKLSDLKFIEHKTYRQGLNLIKLATINEIPAYQFLEGNKDAFINYRQFNYFNTDNEERLLENLSSIKNNYYPLENKYIILFDRQNIVRDGQHRAAILAHLYGINYKIKIMRFYFANDEYMVKATNHNSKTLGKWFLRKVYRKVRGIIRK